MNWFREWLCNCNQLLHIQLKIYAHGIREITATLEIIWYCCSLLRAALSRCIQIVKHFEWKHFWKKLTKLLSPFVGDRNAQLHASVRWVDWRHSACMCCKLWFINRHALNVSAENVMLGYTFPIFRHTGISCFLHSAYVCCSNTHTKKKHVDCLYSGDARRVKLSLIRYI